VLRHEHVRLLNNGSVPVSIFDGALTALRAEAGHVELLTLDGRGQQSYCDERRDICACIEPTYPRWWEQARKHAVCLARVEAHERATGRRFDFVTKVRNDYDFRRRGNGSQPASSAAAVVSAMRAAVGSRTPRIHLQPWAAHSLSPACYAGADWFALVPRESARAFFNFSNAVSCGWARCEARKTALLTSRRARTCAQSNERLLVEWLLAHNVSVAPLPAGSVYAAAQPLARQAPTAACAGSGVDGVAVAAPRRSTTSHELIDRMHAWHAFGLPAACGVAAGPGLALDGGAANSSTLSK
jgi:hypothetical protein